MAGRCKEPWRRRGGQEQQAEESEMQKGLLQASPKRSTCAPSLHQRQEGTAALRCGDLVPRLNHVLGV